ncbi:MAG: RIP metalloprotease RseP [Ruminococcaceae bacterium]|nr:RIP metalloprotease RseP [Oscillospiraceae bacterium]
MDFNFILTLADVKAKGLPILIGVLFFGLIIAIHEFGHFIFAKLFGVKVNEFAIGMGPTILKKQGKETVYALRLFPIGGFVSMEGEGEESDDERAYCNQKTWKKMIIISAGAVFNLILGLILCVILISGQDAVGSNRISGFYEGAMSNSVLQLDDEIIRIDGKRVFSNYDITFLMQRNASGKFDFTVKRDGEKLILEDVPFQKITSGNFGYKDRQISSVSANLKRAGLDDGDIITAVNGKAVKNDDELIALIRADEDYTLDLEVLRGEEKLSFEGLKLATVTIFDFTVYPECEITFNKGEQFEFPSIKELSAIFKESVNYSLSLGRMVYLSLFDLISGQYGLNDISGPIGTMSIITDIAEESVETTDYSTLFMLFAMITINIGLFNLLPVPALDGGHLFFMFFELILRRKIPQKYVSWISGAGLALLLIFMAVVSANDIWKLISGIGFM